MRASLITAVAAAFIGVASLDASASLVVKLNGATISGFSLTPILSSTSTNAPGFDVYYLSVVESSGGTTAVQAASLTAHASSASAPFQFPDGDAVGGVGSGTSQAAINSRSSPDGTFFFLPTATATVATNPDDAVNGFASGTSQNLSIQTFRSGAAYTTTAANGLILGALVVPHGGRFTLSGVVNSTLDSVNNVPFSVLDPEPVSAGAFVLLGCMRRPRRR